MYEKKLKKLRKNLFVCVRRGKGEREREGGRIKNEEREKKKQE
jgi:hypothetical protein